MKTLVKHLCVYCKSVQYIPATLEKVAHKMLCYVCGNAISKEKQGD